MRRLASCSTFFLQDVTSSFFLLHATPGPVRFDFVRYLLLSESFLLSSTDTAKLEVLAQQVDAGDLSAVNVDLLLSEMAVQTAMLHQDRCEEGAEGGAGGGSGLTVGIRAAAAAAAAATKRSGTQNSAAISVLVARFHFRRRCTKNHFYHRSRVRAECRLSFRWQHFFLLLSPAVCWLLVKEAAARQQRQGTCFLGCDENRDAIFCRSALQTSGWEVDGDPI